ncbi:MAG: DNA translocase FtsK 4TM domain-containing protein [Anaerolineae bacterium]|nr:DNA translocase FtsK 4TM domain-containing protein [Anaerolineae bacterium]
MSDAPRVPGSGNTDDDKDKDQGASKSPFASKSGSTPSPFAPRPAGSSGPSSTGNLPAGTRPLGSSNPPGSPFGSKPSTTGSPFGNKPADPPKTSTNPSPFGGGASRPPTSGSSPFGAKKDDDKKDDDKAPASSSPKLGAPSSPPPKADDKKDDRPAGGGLPKLGGGLFGGGAKKDDDKKDDKPAASGGAPKFGGNLFGGGKKDDDKKDDKPAASSGAPKLGGNLFGGGAKKDDDKKDDKPAGGGLPKLGGNLFGGGAKKDDDKKDDKPAASGGAPKFGGNLFGGGRKDDAPKPAAGGSTAPATPKLGTSAPAKPKDDAKKDDGKGAGFGSVGARLGGLFNRGGDDKKDAKAGDKPATPKLGAASTPAVKKDDKAAAASTRNPLGSVGTRLGSLFGRKDGGTGDDKKALKAPQVAADPKKTGTLPGKAAPPPTRLDKPARPLERASSGIEVKNRGLSLDQKLDLVGYALIIAALVMIGGLIQPTQGSVTSGVANLLGQLFGLGRYVWPAISLFIGGWLLIRRFKENPLLEIDALRVIGFTILFLTFVTVLQFSELIQHVTPDTEALLVLSDQIARQQLGGGWVGHQLYTLLVRVVNEWGVPVVLIGFLAIGNMLTFEITMGEIALYLQGIFRWFTRAGRSYSERAKIAAEATAKRKAERMEMRRLEMEARRAKLLAAAPVTVGMPTTAPTPAAAALTAAPDTKSLPEPTKLRGKVGAPVAEIPATTPAAEEAATPAIPKLSTPKPLGKTSTATAEAAPAATPAPAPVALKTPEPVGASAAPAVPKLSTPPPPLGRTKPADLPAEDESTRPMETTKPMAVPSLGGSSSSASPFARPASSPSEVKAEVKPADTPEPAKPSFLRPNAAPSTETPAAPALGKSPTAVAEQPAEPDKKPEEKKGFFSPFRANDKQNDKASDAKTSKPNIFAAANPFRKADDKAAKPENGGNGSADKAPEKPAEAPAEPAKSGLFGTKPAATSPSPSPFKAADTQSNQPTSSVKAEAPTAAPVADAAKPADKVEDKPTLATPTPGAPPSPFGSKPATSTPASSPFGNKPSPFGAKPDEKKPEPESAKPADKVEDKPAAPEPAKTSSLSADKPSPFGSAPAKPASGIFGNKPAEPAKPADDKQDAKPAEDAIKPEELEPAKPKGIVVENPIPLGTSTPLKTSTGVFGSKPTEAAKPATDDAEDDADEVDLKPEELQPAKPKGIVVENPIPLGTSTPLKTSTGVFGSKPTEAAKPAAEDAEDDADEVDLKPEELQPAKPKGITQTVSSAPSSPFGAKPTTAAPSTSSPFGSKPSAEAAKPAADVKKTDKADTDIYPDTADDMSEPLSTEPAKPKGTTQTVSSAPSSPFGAKPAFPTKPSSSSPFGSKPADSPFKPAASTEKPAEKADKPVNADAPIDEALPDASAAKIEDKPKSPFGSTPAPSPFGSKPTTTSTAPSSASSPFGAKPSVPPAASAPSPFKAATKPEPVPTASTASADLKAELEELEQAKPAASAVKPAEKVEAKPAAVEAKSEPASTSAGLPAFSRGTYGWNMPDVAGLLDKGSEQQIQEDVIEERKRMIEETLEAFGAPGKIVEVNAGPVITQFGVEPGYLSSRGKQTRVKVSAIAKLDADLALALAARSIRIEAPVPGKGYVGIEVPNAKTTVVGLRDLMEAPEFRKINSRLRIALGKSVEGAPIVADLTAMPHMLIAGTTGSGKSVCVNAIISCLLVQNSPDDLKMVMVDPKRVELTGYNGIPHLVSNVVVDLERIVGVLKWVSREMDERYKKFSAAGARNIVDYNSRIGPLDPKLPYLVVVIDELADLMMLAPEETEKVLTRLAQMARATGIHLILSTQRPSVDVVTGLIKANFPSRISFMVASSVDSRVILDQPGAEKLLGRGDMLYQAPDAPAPLRVQGVYVSDAEINRITQHWKLAKYEPGDGSAAPALTATTFNATEKPAEAVQSRREMFGGPRPSGTAPQAGTRSGWEPSPDPTRKVYTSTAQREATNGDEDDMYEEAVALFKKTGKVSVSLLQRQLRVGYTRAERLIKLMKQKGVITDADSSSDSE